MQKSDVRDNFRRKSVPFAVFMQYRRIYRETNIYELRRDANKKREVSARIKIVEERYHNQVASGVRSTSIAGIVR